MPLPEKPLTRVERYLARLAGQDVSIPDTPITRIEEYLAYILGQGGGVPAPNAGAHNAIFRGKNLGSEFTSAQADAIDAGTFDDLFVGDYWEAGNPSIKYRIAGFDHFLNMGNPQCKTHHAVIVPDSPLTHGAMNTDSEATGGYAGSYLKTELLPALLTSHIIPIFGEGHIIERYSCLGTSPSSASYVLTNIDLLGEGMIIGYRIYEGLVLSGEKKYQLPLFALAPYLVVSDASRSIWTQSQSGADTYCVVAVYGSIGQATMTNSCDIRPYFCVGKAPAPSPGTRSPLPDYEAKRLILEGSVP